MAERLPVNVFACATRASFNVRLTARFFCAVAGSFALWNRLERWQRRRKADLALAALAPTPNTLESTMVTA